LEITNHNEAKWEDTLPKEIPRNHVKRILEISFPNSKIMDVSSQHIPGVDWIINENDNIYKIDDKNDRWLGYTGNISLDDSTLKCRDTIQLFINFPKWMWNYLYIVNNGLDVEKVISKAKKHKQMKQPWGGYTITHIIPIKEIEYAIPKNPPLINPNLDWFKIVREKTEEE